MSDPATVQAALNQFLTNDLRKQLDGHRLKVCDHLQGCRTPVMGGMKLSCDRCGKDQLWYHGCRDRHCPQCQSHAVKQWAERQSDSLLPVRYFHLVFTLPHPLNGWVALHPEVIYRLLFSAVWGSLKAFGENPRRLGGQLGMTAVLHTWGQNLSRHVHLHCLMPGGALTEGGCWHEARGNYLFPVRALSRRFRGRMVSLLRQSAEHGELHRVKHAGETRQMLDALMKQEWVVYARDCLNHRRSVVDYLARYTRRIAITNRRIISVDEGGVRFRYKDYRTGRDGVMTLAGAEFIRRYLMHVLPRGLMRVRHYGFLCNRLRRQKVACIKSLLSAESNSATTTRRVEAEAHWPCPACSEGKLLVVAELTPIYSFWRPPG